MNNTKEENQLKIGFIKATNDIDVQWYPPLAFGYLKAYLDRNLKIPVSMTLLDPSEGFDNFEIIGLSATTQDYLQAVEIVQKVKQTNRNILTILGGHHITYLPETLSKDFDIGVRGEGEQTFFELISYFQKYGAVLIPEKLKNIQGIVFREVENIIITEKRQFINIEELPHPDRQIGGMQYLFTSRGCPFKCSFCSSSAFWEKTRFFNAEYVVEEMEQMVNQFPDMKQIPIWDDLFIADKKRLIQIIEVIEKKGINKKVNFNFAVRANLIDEEMCEALKRLSVNGVSFGAESGSDRILKLMNKGVTVSQNQRALDLLYEYRIPVSCSFIIGWPTETEGEVLSTFDFILRNIAAGKLVSSNAVNILAPIPGTVLWDDCIRDGIIDLENFDWKRLAAFASHKDSKFTSLNEWVAYRRSNNSLYLNQNNLPIERLYELMEVYYHTLELFNVFKNTLLRENEKKQTFFSEKNTNVISGLLAKVNAVFQTLRLKIFPRNSFCERLLFTYKTRHYWKEDVALINSSELFDEKWYLENNPDVAKTRIDPLIHYLLYGGFEGRDPGPNFFTRSYIEKNIEVRNSSVNPLVHYLKLRKSEERKITL